jgi:N-acetylglucosamine malate deacetylase 1
MIRTTPQEVLVLSPHPDDESLGCGGTAQLIASSGGHVDVVYMTRGEMGLEAGVQASQTVQKGLAERRSREALEACHILGVRRVSFLNGPDGRLDKHLELSDEILKLLHAHDYRSVFCPWHGDGHSDHRATFAMLLDALRRYPKEIGVWLYEVWTPLPPNMVIPIDATLDVKLAAIQAHQSQLAVMDYATAFRALAQYRSLFCPFSKVAEAFYTCDKSDLIEDPEGVAASLNAHV